MSLAKLNVKKGDTVLVLSGKDKGKQGKVIEAQPKKGKVIVEGFAGADPVAQPGCLVRNHGPFSWGKDAAQAVYHAVVIEEIAKMARDTELLCGAADKPAADALAPQYLLDKHYLRKHGPNAYYGQGK